MQPEMTASSSATQDSFGCNSSLLLRHGFWLSLEPIFILSIVKAIAGLRVSDDEERMGLDLSQHDERAYE